MTFRIWPGLLACFLPAWLIAAAPAEPNSPEPTPLIHKTLDDGFHDLYNLSFSTAHKQFEQFESSHPADPLGPVFDAAAYLFGEFNRLHILESQFFVNDKTFQHRDLHPDPAIRQKFEAALDKAHGLADARLRQNPKDEIGLFANVMRLGLHADYLSLIDRKDLDALRETKEGRELAEQLLALHPDCFDAYIAVGVENYLLSLKPAPIRWILHATGAQTDKETGLKKLELTAQHGHYLQPYAELLLAVAALRDGQDAKARQLLTDLSQRFPGNPLYAQELHKLH